jgi:Protein of unknown function (DUF4038)
MKLKLVAALCFIAVVATAQRGTTLPKLKVSADRHFLVQDNGKPFFYLADTAWELFHRLGRKDAAEYLKIRASQGYTAIQAVALAEFDGLVDPNAYGKLPLIDKDPPSPLSTPELIRPILPSTTTGITWTISSTRPTAMGSTWRCCPPGQVGW